MNPKIFIVILIVLVVIFAVGIFAGSRPYDPGSDGEINFFDSSLARDIRARFSTRVRLDEMALNTGSSPDGCLLQNKQMTIPADVSLPCRLDIDAAEEDDSDSVRTMTLHFAGGPPGAVLQVRLEQPNSDKALTVNKDLPFGERVELEVYEGAARLIIGACPADDDDDSAVGCTINLTVADAAEGG
jgi:hypothetical protein